MPYFSYISMLHLYESLGWWRRSSETKRVHFAEEWNEYHHLLIMESLGGDQKWFDRFLAQHAAVFYYWILIGLWALSPSLAYNFSELIEAHAVDTYGEFVDANEELLKSLPAAKIARQYYTGADLYFFDEFQVSVRRGERRPEIKNLYDVFANIRDDEKEHVATMAACQDRNVIVSSPRTEIITAATIAAALASQRYFGSDAGQEAAADLAERAGLVQFLERFPIFGTGLEFLTDAIEALLRSLPFPL
uniref:Alternative oxidase n=2 Tax=Phaeomonas parva TaxID=124430 RepID=A0A7S1XNH1_9STRA|mmetsp:Transcript_20141/g.61110  ORF Transcript_20141/g.61110 Transcript_20141/m.61110 type:complete len:248 (+) Transcript_20141:772-1515(+)